MEKLFDLFVRFEGTSRTHTGPPSCRLISTADAAPNGDTDAPPKKRRRLSNEQQSASGVEQQSKQGTPGNLLVFPGSEWAYRISRAADEVLIRIPGLNLLSSNFEIVARKT